MSRLHQACYLIHTSCLSTDSCSLPTALEKRNYKPRKLTTSPWQSTEVQLESSLGTFRPCIRLKGRDRLSQLPNDSSMKLPLFFSVLINFWWIFLSRNPCLYISRPSFFGLLICQHGATHCFCTCAGLHNSYFFWIQLQIRNIYRYIKMMLMIMLGYLHVVLCESCSLHHNMIRQNLSKVSLK